MLVIEQTMLFVIEAAKETILNFSPETVSVFYFNIMSILIDLI